MSDSKTDNNNNNNHTRKRRLDDSAANSSESKRRKKDQVELLDSVLEKMKAVKEMLQAEDQDLKSVNNSIRFDRQEQTNMIQWLQKTQEENIQHMTRVYQVVRPMNPNTRGFSNPFMDTRNPIDLQDFQAFFQQLAVEEEEIPDNFEINQMLGWNGNFNFGLQETLFLANVYYICRRHKDFPNDFKNPVRVVNA